MLHTNTKATRGVYPDELRSLMNIPGAHASRQLLALWPGVMIPQTPLRSLPDCAARLGIGSVLVKDESVRSPLGSFKALGAPVALLRLVMRLFPLARVDPGSAMRGQYAALLADMTVISATDGNHGRALAAAASSLGCQCVIVLHAKVTPERAAAIAAYGARIVHVEGNYDDAVAEAERLAGDNGWHVVSDTSYPGYDTIPRDVMQGYGVIAAEVAETGLLDLGHPARISHVIVQGGVGGLAAGVFSYLWEYCGAARPAFIVAEPVQADCLLQSAMRGAPSSAGGSVDSVMAGLACGETSPLAWRFLEHCVDHFMTIADAGAVGAMREAAAGSARDVPLLMGESGAAGLAALAALCADRAAAARIGLDQHSHVLLINSEGATAPALYQQLTGETADSVLARQQAWLARQACAA